MSIVVLSVVIAIVCAAGVWLVVRRGAEVRALAGRGRLVTGRVVEKESRHGTSTAGRSRRVKLAYDHPEAGAQERWVVVGASEWEVLEAGEAVELVYLADQPAVFATRNLVNHARRAKGLGPM
jgi:hypothetical protein